MNESEELLSVGVADEGAEIDTKASETAPEKLAEEKKPDTLVDVIADMFAFTNERHHRHRAPEPADSARMTELMNRLRAFKEKA